MGSHLDVRADPDLRHVEEDAIRLARPHGGPDQRRLGRPGGLADRQVGEEEVVVHHQDVRARGVPARVLVEALLEMGAARAEAHVAVALHLVPHLRRRLERQVLERPVLRRLQPRRDRLQLLRRGAVHQREPRVHRQLRPADRDVVPPPLHRFVRPPAVVMPPGQAVLLVARRLGPEAQVIRDPLRVLAENASPGVILHGPVQIEVLAGDVPYTVTGASEWDDVAVLGRGRERAVTDLAPHAVGADLGDIAAERDADSRAGEASPPGGMDRVERRRRSG